MKNKIDSSRAKTPWDNCTDKTIWQFFIVEKYKDNFSKKHQKLSETNEKDISNSITITNYRYCLNKEIIKCVRTKKRNTIILLQKI